MNVFTKAGLLILCLSFSAIAYAQRTYYISNSGNDANSGTSEARPWKSMSKVNNFSFSPGDKILFQRGNRWDKEFLPRSSGSPGKRIVVGAYGSGNKPIIAPTSGPYAINVRIKSYWLIENLHVIAPPTGHGIALRGDARGNEVRYCLVEGNKSNQSRSGITFSVIVEGKYGTSNSIRNNEVFNFFEGIIGSGGMKKGGVVENNYIHDMRPGGEDGIVAKRGDFEGLVIRNNEIKGWRDDGIDLFGGNNVIVEYNQVHDVASQLNGSGNGIKAGGAGVKSENCIIRYNKVYNINPSSSSGLKNGISTNGGDKVQIYGNLIYNVKGEALTVPKESNNVTIYHNTAISNGKEALYVAGTNVTIRNNIFWGGSRDLNINQPVKGSNNLFVDGAKQTKYSGANDIIASASKVFANVSGKDYRLKKGSPAVDKGITISGYNTSIEKKSIKGSPDIGAYEFEGNSVAEDPDPIPAPAPETPSAGTDAWLESECASTIGGVWELNNDSRASGGQYLKVKPGNSTTGSPPTGSAAALTFGFSVSKAGQYKIYTRHLSLNQGDNSFWIQINDGSWINAHVGVSGGNFAWEQLKSTTYALNKGNNQIRVAYREPNARLDKLYVTLAGDAPSGKGGSTTNCVTSVAPSPNPPSAPTSGIVSVNISDKSVTLPQQKVTLSGSGTGPHPFRGYLWEKVSGPSVRIEDQNTANAQLYNLQAGTYQFRFTATDSEGNSGSGQITLSVSNGNNARLAQFGKNTMAAPSDVAIVEEMSVYPNPVLDSKVFIQLPDAVQEAEIQIYGYDGKLLRTLKKMAVQGVIEIGKNMLPKKGNVFMLSVTTDQQRRMFRLLMD